MILREVKVLIIATFVFVGSLFFLSSCVEDLIEPEYDSFLADRTILVYMAADNNLYSNAIENINDMKSIMDRSLSQNKNLIIYIDGLDSVPVLINVQNRCDTIMVYEEQNSADGRTLAKVISYVKRRFPAKSYGLIMWSHGSGWLSSEGYSTVLKSYRAPDRDRENSMYFPYDVDVPSPRTKAFGYDQPEKQWMSIADLKNAIPDGLFDFIVFDACFMGSVEVLYSLRNKAENIVASPYEIVSYGFPYKIIIPQLFNNDLLGACNSFYQYYDKKSSWERTAGISIIETSELDSLALCFKKIVAGKESEISVFDIDNVQRFDIFKIHTTFDLLDFVDDICSDTSMLEEFTKQLERCVIFSKSTSRLLDEINVHAFCGMSVYIPISLYNSNCLNADYRQTEWSVYTGYGQ